MRSRLACEVDCYPGREIYADHNMHRQDCEETAAALQSAVQANHFGVMQVHNLKETMAKKGVEFTRECLIFEVCWSYNSFSLMSSGGTSPQSPLA